MISRKTFIAAASATIGLGGTASAKEGLDYHFDAGRFDTIVRSRAKHKMCFGSTYNGGGVVLDLMTHLYDAYERAEGPGSARAVAVFYHGPSYTMALESSFWRDVLVPYVRKGGASRAGDWGDVSRNPYLGDPARGAASVTELAKRGAKFFVCNNAVSSAAEEFARELGATPAAMYRKIVDALVPAALLVPTGVMAIDAAQAAGFSYLQATLS